MAEESLEVLIEILLLAVMVERLTRQHWGRPGDMVLGAVGALTRAEEALAAGDSIMALFAFLEAKEWFPASYFADAGIQVCVTHFLMDEKPVAVGG